MSRHLVIGIDPGFGETGLVLRHADERDTVLAYQVLSAPEKGTTMQRVLALANAVLDTLGDWLGKWQPEQVEVVIERPIYNANADAFEKQWRTYQAILCWVMDLAVSVGLSFRIRITEVPPSTSKKLATGYGGANKSRIALASPFARADFKRISTWWTVADAWAHSLAAGDACKQCVKLDVGAELPEVEYVVTWNE